MGELGEGGWPYPVQTALSPNRVGLFCGRKVMAQSCLHLKTSMLGMDWRRQGGCRGRSGNHRLDGREQRRLSVASREIQGEMRRKKSGFFLASRLPLMKAVADSSYVTGRAHVPTGSLPGRSCDLVDLLQSPVILPGFA